MNHRTLLVIFLTLPGITFPSVCARASQDSPPVISLELGMHTAPIRRVAVDAGQATLVTASDDKSARIWDIAKGALLATLRPPVGRGDIGRLYGVAVAPDNRIALGGTTAGPDGLHLIYFFDLHTHAVIGSFDARGGNIKRLEFAPGGELLAAAYADSPAVRVFDRKGIVVYEERLSGDAYYVTFSSEGRMAVTASDGAVHLYKVSGNRISSDGIIKTVLADPRGIHFSPDGKLLAVGYLSRTDSGQVRVDVFDVGTKTSARSFLFSDVPRGNLMNVAWQSDGRALYVGGTGYRADDRFIVKRIGWPDGHATEIGVGQNSILDIVPLRNGAVLFSTAEPAWGVIQGETLGRVIAPPTARFYDASTLQVSDDATQVSWRYRSGEAPVHFNLKERVIRDGIGDARRTTTSSTIPLRTSDWENTFNPMLNGRPIPIDRSEVSRAAATLPDNSGILLGTSRSLRRVDRDGKQSWTTTVPAEVRAVNVSVGGKLAVTAMLDGTIRWWRVSDGTPLLSLLPTIDRKWVLWSEDGYFDVAPGAEEQVGWTVRRPEGDRSDFFPLSRFRARYFRPDIIDRVLVDADISTAAKHAQAKPDADSGMGTTSAFVDSLPPVVTLLSPGTIESSESAVTLAYTVWTRAALPVSIAVSVDGRPYGPMRNELVAASDGRAGEIRLNLPARDAVVQLFATNQNGTSPPVTVHYRYLRDNMTADAVIGEARPRLFVLAVGVSDFRSKAGFDVAAEDAAEIAELMRKQEGELYGQVAVKVVSGERATRTALLDGLRWLGAATSAGDIGVLYLAGRAAEDTDRTFYFLPFDGKTDDVRATCIAEDELIRLVSAMKGKAVLFFDTRWVAETPAMSTPDMTRLSNRLSSPEYGAVVFSATRRRERLTELPRPGSSDFALAVREGLAGRADLRGRGVVSYSDLGYFVINRVVQLTQGRQTPILVAPSGVQDFSLAKLGNKDAPRNN